tara:strand:- start:1067 stop:2488 length:1422 start_codon:yes stop_codon:yes gene_type:complete
MIKHISLNIFIILLSIAICVSYKPVKFEAFDNFKVFILIAIAVFNVMYFLINTTKINKSWVNYNTLFLTGFLIVHFQIPFFASLGYEPYRPSFIWINKQVVNYSVWLSCLAILFWMLGYLLYASKNWSKLKIKKRNNYFVKTNIVDYLLLILFIVFVFLVGKEFLSGIYDGGENWGFGANYVFLILRTLLYLRIIYFFINTRFQKITLKNILIKVIQNKIFFGVLFFFFFIFLFSGDRGPVLNIIIIIGVCYSLYQRNISLSYFLIAGFLVALLLTVIGLGRTSDSSEKTGIFETGYINFTESELGFNPTYDLASSNRILFRAIDIVPSSHPYLFGLTFVSEIVGVIPFAGSKFKEIMNLPEMYKSTSTFFTVLGQGKYYSYGEGSEILGDIWVNFGFYGVLILMFLMGLLISYFNINALYTYKHFFIIFYILLTVGAIYINRSHFLDPLRLLFYAFIIDKLLAKKISLNVSN